MSRANFVQVRLAAAATDIQKTLTVKAPEGGLKLPPADGGRLVLTDSPGRPSAFEIITYTSRTGSGPYTLNGVTRGLEGTVGLVWGVDTFAMQTLTVGEFEELLDKKVDKASKVIAGTGLGGGGNLSADRTLSVKYGTTAGTAAQGNDSRLSNSREWTATTVSQAEAGAGVATTRRAWTAQRVRQAITGWWAGSAEKTKLDGIQEGAQVNTVDSVAGRTGAVVVSKADVKLNNVDNTSDMDKPVSTAQQAALDLLDPSKLPALRPSLRLDFINNPRLDPRVSFTRSTGGGRFNAQGQYEWVGPDEPRIDYDPKTGECLGLLVEGQRTNLYRQNALLGVISGSGSTFALIDGPNPEFGKFIHVDGAGTAVTPAMTIPVQEGQSYTLSVYSDKPTPLSAYLWSGAGGNYTDTVVTPVGGGLYRHTRPIGVVPAGVTSSRPHFSGVSGHTLGWIQVEEGTFPTSYIPTEGSAVTRAKDAALVDNLSPWYNPEQGTLIASVASGDAIPVIRGIMCIEDARGTSASRSFAALIGVDNSTDFAQDGTYLAPNFPPVSGDIALGMSGSWEGSTMAQNGLVESTPRTVGSGRDRMWVGSFVVGNHPANMHIKSLTYYPHRLTDTELQGLTAND